MLQGCCVGNPPPVGHGVRLAWRPPNGMGGVIGPEEGPGRTDGEVEGTDWEAAGAEEVRSGGTEREAEAWVRADVEGKGSSGGGTDWVAVGGGAEAERWDAELLRACAICSEREMDAVARDFEDRFDLVSDA